MRRRLPRLRSQKLTNATALAVAAAMMLVPANVLPVLSTQSQGQSRTDTIFSGTVELWRQGLWFIAAIVFIASIVIPVLKLAGLTWLLLAARRRQRSRHARMLTRVFGVIDFVGRWSMLDVFLVAFLSGVVRFGAFSRVVPEKGILAFAAAVVLTVLATRAFDPRVLWREPAPMPGPTPNFL